MSWQLASKSIAGVFAIGTVNLLVSFGLALWVALRSRQVRFKHGLQLMKLLGKRFLKAPIHFFIGPKNPAPVALEDDTAIINKGHK